MLQQSRMIYPWGCIDGYLLTLVEKWNEDVRRPSVSSPTQDQVTQSQKSAGYSYITAYVVAASAEFNSMAHSVKATFPAYDDMEDKSMRICELRVMFSPFNQCLVRLLCLPHFYLSSSFRENWTGVFLFLSPSSSFYLGGGGVACRHKNVLNCQLSSAKYWLSRWIIGSVYQVSHQPEFDRMTEIHLSVHCWTHDCMAFIALGQSVSWVTAFNLSAALFTIISHRRPLRGNILSQPERRLLPGKTQMLRLRHMKRWLGQVVKALDSGSRVRFPVPVVTFSPSQASPSPLPSGQS